MKTALGIHQATNQQNQKNWNIGGIIPRMKPPEPPDAPESWTDQERRATFDRQQKIMSMFSDNAKTYIQLSSAALALTLTFAHEILRIPKDRNIADPVMVAMWCSFLVAIVAGAYYQYLAVKFLEASIDWDQLRRVKPRLQPGTVYGIMLGAFYGGTIIFTFYAAVRLWRG